MTSDLIFRFDHADIINDVDAYALSRNHSEAKATPVPATSPRQTRVQFAAPGSLAGEERESA
jgi:hypothetical protein